ncbi:MAG: FAD-dependent oxidoreductase [Acidimicrobiales bacterium]
MTAPGIPDGADREAFPTLDDRDLAAVEELGTRRAVAPGEYLFREGDVTYDFFVVLTGEVAVVTGAGDDERLLTSHGPGRFLGELNLLTGMRVFVSARVLAAGEVLVVPREQLRQIIATRPGLGDTILAALIARRGILLTGAAATTRVIGSRFSPGSLQVREFLARARIPHEWLDPDRDGEVEAVLRAFEVDPGELPVVITSGRVLRSPTPGSLAEYLGLTVQSLPGRCFDLVIVGGGPAGLAAAVYGASEGLRTLGVERMGLGGQAGTSSRIENYLGFPTGISGSELAQRAFAQAEKFGAHLTAPCEAVSLREDAGHLVLRLSDGTDVAGRAVIVASGARYRRLGVDRLEEFEGSGVFYAATEMEARQCAASPVMVVGGGNSAGQAAMFLAGSGCTVDVVVRGPDLGASMSRYLVERIEAHPEVTVHTGSQVTALDGERWLGSVSIEGPAGERRQACSGLFSFIGAEPASGWLTGCAAVDDHGFVLTDVHLGADHLDDRWQVQGRAPLPYETNHPGLFAVGDVRSGSTKRVAAAVGEGSACVGSVHRYLSFAH